MRTKTIRQRATRYLLGTLAALTLVSPVRAADYDALRGAEPIAPVQTVGPATFTRWSGFYFGGQFGVDEAYADFANSTQQGAAYTLRETLLEQQFSPSQWPVLGNTNTPGINFGGFVGYSTQWQDLVLSLEANLNRAAFSLTAPNSPIARTVGPDSGGNVYTVNLSGSGSVTNIDLATLRVRAGYVVGNLLPYGFVGAAFGLANVSVSTTVAGEEYTSGSVTVCNAMAPCSALRIVSTTGANNEIMYGFAVGGGVDWAILPNVFLRAEFEWDQFNPPPGILLTVATGRVGAGFKF
jgi:opacity protein-like surface antigen